MAPRKYATLVSVDGMEFIVPLEACYASPMLAAGVGKNARFGEAGTQRIKLETIRSVQSSPPPGSCQCPIVRGYHLPMPPPHCRLSMMKKAIAAFFSTEPLDHEVALNERHLHLN